MTAPFAPQDLFVSPDGNDEWSGALETPNSGHTDGPFATLHRARKEVRSRRARGLLGTGMTVWVRGGTYPLLQPMRFTPADSGPVTYAAYPGETPVLDGGVRITGWSETEVNGVTAWIADVSEHLQEHGAFRSLFVNGGRRFPPRLPKTGFHRMADTPGIGKEIWSNLFKGSNRFRVHDGDIQSWRNLQDIDVIVMHFWIEERMPIRSFDPETGWVESSRQSIFILQDDVTSEGARYFVENVFEALTDPGEYYLDKSEGKLYYIPMPGERIDTAEIVAPVALQLVRIEGDPASGRTVDSIRFEGLAFRHTDWVQAGGTGQWYDPYRPRNEWHPRRSYGHFIVNNGISDAIEFANMPQAAFHVPGVISFWGAKNCAVEDCALEHIGFYGIDLGEGCFGNRIIGNTVTDGGSGGVKLDGGDHNAPRSRQTGMNRVTDNHLHDLGHVYMSACGIASCHSYGNEFSHNHIHDLYYTGISCGWTWGYCDNISRENRIEKNHIHDLGKKRLSDMGGIYTLGVQPGTAIRGNVIHDVEKANYGGWAIYPDEGSSHILIENNVCYRTSSQPFHMHFGREVIIRNNIWAFGREGQIAISKGPEHDYVFAYCGVCNTNSFTFERNIVLTDGEPVFVGAPVDGEEALKKRPFTSDLNLFWNVANGPILSGVLDHGAHGTDNLKTAVDWDAWQRLGYDMHSVIADPCFADPESNDFTLAGDSPALALGFRPIDTSDVGVRPKEKRVWV